MHILVLTFSVFSIYFIINFIIYYQFKSKEIFLTFLLNSILALPAFYFIFYMEVNFLSISGAVGIDANEKNFFNNISNDILITFSLIFFLYTAFHPC